MIRDGGAGGRRLPLRALAAVALLLVALGVGASQLGQTGTARAAGGTATFGKTTVGASSDVFAQNRKRVNLYVLPTTAALSKLSIYLQPSSAKGQQVLKGVVYANASGAPGALLAVSKELVYHSTEAAGWQELTFSSPVSLPGGSYWIGVITGEGNDVAGYRYDTVAGSRDYNANTYSSGPSNPFGSTVTTDGEQMSIYATYTSTSEGSKPVELSLPTISGVAESGQRLTASPGSWTESPTSYAYQWQRCSSTGTNCSSIPGATSSSYTLTGSDVGSTIRVSTSAYDTSGSSTPAYSATTANVSSSAGSHHLEYVFNDGAVYVYDMDQGYKAIGTISFPQTAVGIRGVTVSPASHLMFISYGGDGGSNGNGSVLAYNLVSDEVVWTVHLNTGIDSGQVSPDGKLLYMPTGESSSGRLWNILETSDGAVVGTIEGGFSPHNTVVSHDGRYVYLGARYDYYLDVYDTVTGKVRSIGPMVQGVRPFTINGSNTLAFTTATGFDGFQVSSITTGKVLFTVSFGSVPANLPDSAPSHGVSLSPNERELFVVDDVNKAVQVYDVSGAASGIAPTPLATIPVSGLSGTASPCAYDCARGGWLQRSTDGRFVFVGNSGDVIETASRKIIANLPTLLNTKISIEVDWENGVPTGTSGRTGQGEVP